MRRKQRSLDTKIEVMERRLDRSIENKERITVVLAGSLIEDYRQVVRLVREVEAALADMAIIFFQTGGLPRGGGRIISRHH